MNLRGSWRLAAIGFTGAAVLAFAVACGDDDGGDTGNSTTGASAPTATVAGGGTGTTGSTGVTGAELSGAVAIDGSSTVFPITEAVAEEFRTAQGDVDVTVGVSGTGGGFERFCNGEIDVSNASRPISATDEDEVPVCEAGGIDYIEIPVAYDGLAVVVNPENDWIDCITVEQLAMIWVPGAEGTVDSWSDIDPAWPDEGLDLYGPGTDSGTFDYFTAEVNGEEGASRTDYTPSEDDNVLVQGVSGSTGALGYFGLAYLVENEGAVKGVAVDAGAGCIEPTAENVLAGTYPLARPLFIYVNAESAETKPQVTAFVDFYIEHVPTLATDVGYVQFPQEFYAIITERWNSRTMGSLFSGADGTVGEILAGQ
jgi:phosphate transport system substrate-binding protein